MDRIDISHVRAEKNACLKGANSTYHSKKQLLGDRQDMIATGALLCCMTPFIQFWAFEATKVLSLVFLPFVPSSESILYRTAVILRSRGERMRCRFPKVRSWDSAEYVR
jgi:hypothetical protein